MSGYSKYTISQKVQACEDYLAGIRTAKQISSDLGIPPKNHTNIHEWVSKYRLWGEEAFITLSGNKAYTADFKMQMVEKYISGSESVREIVAKYNIGSDVFPETEIQHCIIHQIRNTTKFVSYKDLKALMADLKRVYTVSTEEIARLELEAFA